MIRSKLGFTPLLALMVSLPARADTIESVFEDAARYTVKIETTTEHPFLSDQLGTIFGAGFLVDLEKGWILTNRHVVSEAPSQIGVRFMNSDYLPADKIYLDPQVDLALIRIDREAIPERAIEARLGCNEAPRMGNAVVIFGHPSGLNFTGTRGIVSGTTFVGGNESLQTDAPLNSGNSGGPLISIDSGHVVGVSEARFDADDSEGLNLTVSIDHACRIIALIEQGLNPAPPILPIVFIEHDIDDPRLIVANAYFADRALLRPGDEILGLAGEASATSNIDQLMFLLRGRSDKALLEVLRDGRRIEVEVPLQPRASMLDREALAVSGMTLLNYEPIDRDEGGFDDRVLVAHSAEGSIAYDSWFEARDSIYSINGVRVNSIAQVHELLKPFEDRDARAGVVVRVRSDSLYKSFDYHRLWLKVRDLRLLHH